MKSSSISCSKQTIKWIPATQAPWNLLMMCSCVLLLVGCQSPQRVDDAEAMVEGAHDFVVVDQEYDEVFAAAKEVLASYRFGINRVDAVRGVILSYPKRTAGLATPWDSEQSTLGQEWEDLANQHQRVVRIEFVRSSNGSVDANGSIGLRVSVFIERTHRPNWRLEAESVRLSTHARSRDQNGQLEASDFREVIGHDSALEKRIIEDIRSRLGPT